MSKKVLTPFLATLGAALNKIVAPDDKDDDYCRDVVVTIRDEKYPEVKVEVHREYDRITLNLKKLIAMATLFGTDEIVVDDISMRGCPTCDYGSKYGHTFTFVVPEDKR